LPNVEGIAEDVFGLPVRVGVPDGINGLTDSMAQPQYATAIGLVLFGAHDERDAADIARRRGSVVHRIQKWLSDLWN
jgi:cell division protein FtsA